MQPQGARHAPRGRRIKLPGQHLKSWLADNPYRRAVAGTNREPRATLRDNPVLLVQRPASPGTRRNHLKAANLRQRRMTSHTPLSLQPFRLTQGGLRRRNTPRDAGTI